MAMLAAPRRKQKVINLRAKNNDWSNDTNKFGQRMLEKMGWSEGKGLGANENGIIEHVVARYKNDDKGLGYEDRNDQWTKHEDDFNSLLANLSNGNADEEKLHSGVSLEVKSKKSKARVHYHKFTRGKDLTRYSEKDLANIFGKKSLKQQRETEKQEEEQEKVDNLKTTEQVFTDKGSMVDYFKSKMASFKSKSTSINNHSDYDNDADFAFKGFSGTGNNEDVGNQQTYAYQGFSLDKLNENKNEKENTEVDNTEVDVDVEIKKKRKKKKNKRQDESIEINDMNDTSSLTSSEVLVENKVKKAKKKKCRSDVEPLVEEPVEVKKKKNKTIDSFEDHTEEYVPKKKKKRKNKDIDN